MNSVEQGFLDLGIDAVLGTEIMSLLGMSISDLSMPDRFHKFKSVMHAIKDVLDKEYFIKKVTLKGMNEDKLQKMWEYTELSKKKQEIQKIKDSLQGEKDVVLRFANEKGTNPEDMEVYADKIKELDSVSTSLRQVEEEMSLYER